MAVDWMGNVPSPDLAALIGINQASDFASSAPRWPAGTRRPRTSSTPTARATSARSRPATTRRWRTATRGCRCPAPAPTTSTGSSRTRRCRRSTTRPGTSLATANQRPVGPSTRTTSAPRQNFFDNSYRANQHLRRAARPLRPDPGRLHRPAGQRDRQPGQAVVPRLLAALRQGGGPARPGAGGRDQLAGWNDDMTVNSAAASIWWTFWGDYLAAASSPGGSHPACRWARTGPAWPCRPGRPA